MMIEPPVKDSCQLHACWPVALQERQRRCLVAAGEPIG
jgi:hypothetical protein